MKFKRGGFYLITYLLCFFPNHVLANLTHEKDSSYWAGSIATICQLYEVGHLSETVAKAHMVLYLDIAAEELPVSYMNKIYNFASSFGDRCRKIIP